MLTALIITATATALVLAAIAARSFAAILWPSQPRKLSRRERYELLARLWVP